MTYLLDTNVCIRILNGSSTRSATRLRSEAPTNLALSSVVKAELLYGARHSARVEENLKLLQRFFAPFVSLPFDDECAQQYGMIRADLATMGQLIGPNDMMIAATARARDLTLITSNVGEFARVAGLRIEDWEAAI